MFCGREVEFSGGLKKNTTAVGNTRTSHTHSDARMGHYGRKALFCVRVAWMQGRMAEYRREDSKTNQARNKLDNIVANLKQVSQEKRGMQSYKMHRKCVKKATFVRTHIMIRASSLQTRGRLSNCAHELHKKHECRPKYKDDFEDTGWRVLTQRHDARARTYDARVRTHECVLHLWKIKSNINFHTWDAHAKRAILSAHHTLQRI